MLNSSSEKEKRKLIIGAAIGQRSIHNQQSSRCMASNISDSPSAECFCNASCKTVRPCALNCYVSPSSCSYIDPFSLMSPFVFYILPLVSAFHPLSSTAPGTGFFLNQWGQRKMSSGFNYNDVQRTVNLQKRRAISSPSLSLCLSLCCW